MNCDHTTITICKSFMYQSDISFAKYYTFERVPTPYFCQIFCIESTFTLVLQNIYTLGRVPTPYFSPNFLYSVGQTLYYNSFTIMHSCEKPVGLGLGCFLSQPATSNFLNRVQRSLCMPSLASNLAGIIEHGYWFVCTVLYR